MKTFKKHLIFNRKTLLILTLLLVATLCFALLKSVDTANAQVNPYASLFMPNTALEFDKSLDKPSHVYSDNEILAVVQNKEGSPSVFELLVSKNGNNFSCANQTFTKAIKHIRRLSEKYLLVSSDNSVFTVDISGDLENPVVSRLLVNADPVNCTEFDYNNTILVTSSETSYTIYTVDTENPKATMVASGQEQAKVDTPLCLGDNALFFLDANNNLKMRAVSSEQIATNSETIIENFVIDKMISKGDFIYAKSGADFYKISISNKTKEQMTFKVDENYQLSKVESIGGFCFKGYNLLITDSTNGTIQEFSIEENALTFTGYAVAHGKTAFNRFGTNIADIEQNGNMVAAIDNVNKTFTLVSDTANSFYSRENFKYSACFNKGDFLGFTPNAFALGTKSILFVDKTNKKAKVFDIENNTLLNELDFSKNSEYKEITDVTYQSGRYYLSQLKASDVAFDVVIYSGNEEDLLKGGNLTEMLVIKNSYNTILPVFAVDVFQNVYLTNTQEGFVYKYAKGDKGYEKGEKLANLPTNNVVKLSTDLAGGLFILDNAGLSYYHFATQTKCPINVDNLPLTSISSFSMAIDKSQVYLTFNGEEFIYQANSLPTYTLDKLSCPSEFIISSNNANDINSLKVCQVKKGANVYAFNYSEVNSVKNIEYQNLISLDDNLIFICEFTNPLNFTNSVTREEVFYMLSGKTEDGKLLTAIVNKKDAVLVTPEIGAVKEDYAYTTTGVSMYYLPIITKDANHILKANGESVILGKNVKINTLNTVSAFDIEYYFASVTINDNTYLGYIPCAFTTKVLSKDYKEEKFTVESVNATKVYSAKDLANEIASLSENTSIRLYNHENGVARIGYNVNGEWLEGYISYSAIVQPENNVIRNVLIILAITISVCVTSLFFILRKK